MKRRLVAILSCLTWAAMVLGPGSAHASPSELPDPATLPAPYSGWNVELTPSDTNDQVLALEFDSPLLGRRTTNMVFVPATSRAGNYRRCTTCTAPSSPPSSTPRARTRSAPSSR